MSRRIQRDTVHSFHKLHDYHSLACLRTALSRVNEQCDPGHDSGAFPLIERFGPVGLPIFPKGLHRPYETGKKYKGIGNGSAQKFFLSRCARDSGCRAQR